MRKPKVLTDAHVQQFLREGYVYLPRAVEPDVAREVVDALQAKLATEQGIDYRRPPEFRATVPRQSGMPFAKLNTPTFLDALDDLLSPTRYHARHIESHGDFFFSFPGFHGPPWRPPHGFGPWHIDLGHDATTTFDLSSGNCALVPVFLLTETRAGAGATVIVPGSHRVVAKLLYAAGGTLPRFHMTAFCEHVVTKRVKTLQATGQAGDLYLLHPLLIHSASTNCSAHLRVICNTGIGLEGSRRWMHDGDEHSLVDVAIRSAVDEIRQAKVSPRRIRSILAVNHAVRGVRNRLAFPVTTRNRWGVPLICGSIGALGAAALSPLGWLWNETA
jgi:hypothetical protein